MSIPESSKVKKLFRNKAFISVLFISLIGFALRFFNFGNLLILKSDQARDALLMNNVAKSGMGSIPLLGPQVGSSGFHLGPFFYYFQYFSGKIFGFSPESLAYPDLIFGILTIPLLFLLFRKFFSFALSIGLAVLASVSLMLVTFSRFAWNPNSLPFFSTAFVLSLVIALGRKKNERWLPLIIAAICFGIISQLHLVAILGLALGIIIFIILTRSLTIREISVFLAIFILLQTPLIIGTWNNKGSEFQKLFQTVEKKNTQSAGHNWYEKTFRAYQESSHAMWIVATGQQDTDNILTRGFNLKCDKKCRSLLPFSIISMVLLAYLLVSTFLLWRGNRHQGKIWNNKKIILVSALLAGFFIVTVPLAYQIETRFYLGMVPLFFVILGFGYRVAVKSRFRFLKYAVPVIGILAIMSNLFFSVKFLSELSESQVSAADSGRDLRFGTAPKVTLGQLREIGNEASKQLDPRLPVIVIGETLYVKSMYYVMSAEQGYNGCYVINNKENIGRNFNVLDICYTPEDNSSGTGKISNDYTKFGTLSARFIKGVLGQSDIIFPSNCLNY
jgi:hypothetical protein